MTTPLPCGIDNDLEDYPFGCTTLSLMWNLKAGLFEEKLSLMPEHQLNMFFTSNEL